MKSGAREKVKKLYISFALYCSVIPGFGFVFCFFFPKRHLSSRDTIKPTEAEKTTGARVTVGFWGRKKNEEEYIKHNLKEKSWRFVCKKKKKKTCKNLEKQKPEEKRKKKSLLALKHHLNIETFFRRDAAAQEHSSPMRWHERPTLRSSLTIFSTASWRPRPRWSNRHSCCSGSRWSMQKT